MSIRKKIVWLPYDFDTAIGINNEGELVFGYELEDTDHLSGGADIYNGQESVIWNNIRLAFADELRDMYQQLRSQGKLSYETIERAFEEHQAKWPEALFNEDSQFCYIDPLINDGTNYLPMLQGSKEEQRKWWLYNRFRYIDSKYNAGDALLDLIQLRSYAKSDITVTPYADIYPAVKFGSYLVSKRGKRNVATLLECPVDTLNDTETYIYSASQLASVGDLSGLKVGFADFSMATKLQSLKLGDSSNSYENQNLKTLTLGNNVLLQTIDVRNCTALGSGDMKVVDISHCTGIQKVWFDNTQVTAVTLPIGGVLDTLSLPSTITNLTIRNQPKLTSFTLQGNNYSNISTCRIENTDYFLKNQSRLTTLVSGLPNGARLRLVGLDIDWLADTTAISTWYDSLDRLRGLDINGENLDDAYIEGVIHINSAKGSDIAALLARYPYMRIDATHTESKLYFYNGETLITEQTVLDGGDGSYTGTTPTKANSEDGHYSYTFAGWSKDDDNTVDSDALTSVVADRNVYACFTSHVRAYTVTWVNNGTTVETDTNVAWGTIPHYDGSTPTKDGQTSTGWLPDVTQPITGDTTFTAQYLPVYTVTFKNDTGSTTLDTQNVVQGQNATYGGATPTSSEDASLAWLGWATSANSHTADAVLTNIQSSMTVYAAFESAVEDVEITDSWDTIIANIDNGTYKTKYKIGNYKPIDLGETYGTAINMQIVAMDSDKLASGGTAPLTFLAKELLLQTSKMNTTSTGANGYPATNVMKPLLDNTIYPLLPSNIKERIQRVNKTYYDYTTTSTLTSVEKLWIPSAREMFGGTSYESSGVMYTTVFKDATTRIKNVNGTATRYWLRSASSSYAYHFRCVDSDGSVVNSGASGASGVCLGFCLGLESETISDSWETILANENPSASYSIGDTKMIDLGTEGKHLMEIVAFNEDDKADGTGKAKITWISKTQLNTDHRMNLANSGNAEGTGTIGGWEKSEMRTYVRETIKPLIPEVVRNAIVSVTKISNAYDTTGTAFQQTTTDDVWIPGHREIFNSTSYDQTGAVYSGKFTDATSRIKKRNGSANYWWLRSALSGTYFRRVSNSGNDNYSFAYYSSGVVLGFCTD